MYTLSLMKGFKPKYITCDTYTEAVGLARAYWYLDPMIFDNASKRPVTFDLCEICPAESEY